MNISFHTGKSAMIAQAQALNVYGNNIANVNTVGYQTLRPSFADCIYETYRASEADWQTGHGTYIQKTDLMFEESFFNETGRMIDTAIGGQGFFAVEDRFGEVNFTRDGAFGLTQDQESGDWYLVSGSGEYVLDFDYNRIVVPFEEVGKNSVISQMNWNAIIGQIGAFTSDAAVTSRVRYTYNGEIGNELPARNMDAAKDFTPSQTDPLAAARISTQDGYFAVMNSYGEISYTRDETVSIQKYDDGKWYMGSSSGGFILDYENHLIPVEFGSSSDYGNYFSVNWDELGQQVGVFTFADGELSTSDNTRYNVAATADPNAVMTAEGGALSAVSISNNEAMFAVEGANGIRYTHNVTFDVAFDPNVDLNNDGEADGGWFLSTSQGEYVLDNNNQRILVAETADSHNVDYSALKELIGVFEFPNPYGLDAGGQNRYIANGKSGEPVANRNALKLQGCLITSNVDLSTQMVKLIETQRAYQISSRVVTTSDELQRIANNLR